MSSEQSLPDQPNARFAERYSVVKNLASGSDGATYLVWDEQTDEHCILKQMQLKTLGNWKRLDLFKREARTLAHLDHPQIPALLDYFETRHDDWVDCCLVLQRVSGQTLAERVYQGLHLPEDSCYLIAVQILKILSYLHRFNPPVIHRDIKPSNLILNDQGVVYLIDFGGVQEALALAGAGGSTMIGTYGYMAPEQFSGRALPASDLYGLGATLVFLLSGREPANLPQQNLLLNFRPFVECSAPFANWIEHLLLPTPEQRFQGADEALEVLEAIMPQYRVLSLPAIQERVSRAIQLEWQTLNKPVQEPEDDSAVPVSHVLPPGALIDERYRVEAVLGQGDIAVTYAVTALADQQKCVVRELHFERISNWKSFELYEREVSTLERLKHPGLPRLVEHFEVKNDQLHRFYVVSERIEARNLEEHLRQGWRPTETEVRQVAAQLLALVALLQELDPPLIHRDIKPSNILRDSAGQIYLIDFGAVQDAFRPQGGGGSTVIGTYGYMAPEQFVGKAVPQSDLYGIGTTLIHLLAGRSPSEMPQQELKIQFVDQVRCSQPFYYWLEKMVAPRLEERFASPWEAAESLRKLDNMPLISADLLAEAEQILGQDDPAIVIHEGVDGLQLHLKPMLHDYRSLLALLLGGNIIGLPFLLSLPQIGVLLALALPLGSGLALAAMKQHGQRYQTQISVDPDFFSYRTIQHHLGQPEEVIEELRYPTFAVASLYLEQYEIPNRLVIRVQYSLAERPIVKTTRYPIAGSPKKANYLLKRLRETVTFYQKQQRQRAD